MSDLTKKDVVNIMRDERIVMLTCVAEDGTLHSHPMTPQEVTDDADVWFFIAVTGDQAQALRVNPKANVAFVDPGTWLSVSGRAEFVDDPAKVDELWDKTVSAYFTGKDDPNLGLMLFKSDAAEFWGHPGGKLSLLTSMIKSRVSGDQPDGTMQTIKL